MRSKFKKYCGGCKNVNDDYSLTLESKQKYEKRWSDFLKKGVLELRILTGVF